MQLPPWHEVAIGKEHDRARFDCGDSALNEFLCKHARKNHERGSSKTFLAVPDDAPFTILGFYSLSPASVSYERTPEIARKGLARYDVPVFRLARLAVALSFQGQQLGGKLLLAAGRRALLVASEVGGVALLIDAKHDRAAAWYASYGAMPLLDTPLSLLLPLATVKTALEQNGHRNG
jgi:GNAT superfamily N-acetyltransferase